MIKKLLAKRGGFTLVELLIVIIIIAVLGRDCDPEVRKPESAQQRIGAPRRASDVAQRNSVAF